MKKTIIIDDSRRQAFVLKERLELECPEWSFSIVSSPEDIAAVKATDWNAIIIDKNLFNGFNYDSSYSKAQGINDGNDLALFYEQQSPETVIFVLSGDHEFIARQAKCKSSFIEKLFKKTKKTKIKYLPKAVASTIDVLVAKLNENSQV